MFTKINYDSYSFIVFFNLVSIITFMKQTVNKHNEPARTLFNQTPDVPKKNAEVQKIHYFVGA